MKPKRGSADSDESDPGVVRPWVDAHDEIHPDTISDDDAPSIGINDDESGDEGGLADPHASRNSKSGYVSALVRPEIGV